MKRLNTSFAILLFATSLFAQSGQMSFETYASKSIYSFIRYINWPSQVTNQDFEIAVIGDRAVYAEIDKLLTNRKLGAQNFKISFFKKADEYTGFHHIVFVDAYQNNKLKDLMTSLNSHNTLVISESEGATKNGAMINFVPRDGTMKFELSSQNIESHGLKVDSRLASLALPVN